MNSELKQSAFLVVVTTKENNRYGPKQKKFRWGGSPKVRKAVNNNALHISTRLGLICDLTASKKAGTNSMRRAPALSFKDEAHYWVIRRY